MISFSSPKVLSQSIINVRNSDLLDFLFWIMELVGLALDINYGVSPISARHWFSEEIVSDGST